MMGMMGLKRSSSVTEWACRQHVTLVQRYEHTISLLTEDIGELPKATKQQHLLVSFSVDFQDVRCTYGSDVEAHTAHTDNLEIIPCYCEGLELESGFRTLAEFAMSLL